MEDILPTSGIVVHIWPGQWGLPSFDPLCLATVIYLQLTIPGKFTLVETSNPDSSPSGQLPYLVHEWFTVASFPSIVKYVSGLRSADFATYENADLDIHLTRFEKSQKVAWYAHAEAHLGDLVYHTLYANHDNWANVMSPALASIFPVPQKYYVPRRIRDGYFPRLETAGLWKQTVEEKPKETPFPRDVKPTEKEKLTKNTALSTAFEKEKIIEKASSELDIYKELLEGHECIFQNRLSSVDTLVAAHILLLLDPPFSDPLLKNLLTSSYPTLVTHARRIFKAALGPQSAALTYSLPTSSLWGLLPSWKEARPNKKTPAQPLSPEDLHYNRMRWGFFGVVLGSFAAYLALVGSMYTVEWKPAHVHNAEQDDEEGE